MHVSLARARFLLTFMGPPTLVNWNGPSKDDTGLVLSV